MKRFICLFLSAVFIFESLNIANAEEQIKEEYYNINVEFSDARSETEQIQIMLKNNNIYINAEQIAIRLGYKIAVNDEYIAVYNKEKSDNVPYSMTLFYFDSTKIKHMIFNRFIDYEAVCQSVKNNEGEWIPLEQALLLMNSSMASANDACVAMSEYIEGTESAFVAKMNERAMGLGMNNTNFVNCCGLDTDGHMSTARDIALMSRELITKYPQIHDYSTIWMDTIIHSTRRGDSEFGLTNTNKLIKQYEWATGLKTGSTGLAKCCLSATANKDGIDLIAVIMAAPDSKTRFAEAVNLLNYGFNTCDIYKDDGMPLLENIRISKGKKDYVNCRYEKEFSYMFINPVNHEDISKELHINENIAAPVNEGDTIGTLDYYYNGEKIGSVNVISSENIEKADFLTQIKKVFGRLLK